MSDKSAVYEIEITEVARRTVSVFAESAEQAEECVRERYRDGIINLDADDMEVPTFECVGAVETIPHELDEDGNDERDAAPEDAEINALAPAPEPAGDADDDEDDEPPALEDVLASIAARAPKSDIVLLDGGKARTIPARTVQDLFPMPCGTVRRAVRDVPMYARDDAGRLVVCEQPMMF